MGDPAGTEATLPHEVNSVRETIAGPSGHPEANMPAHLPASHDGRAQSAMQLRVEIGHTAALRPRSVPSSSLAVRNLPLARERHWNHRRKESGRHATILSTQRDPGRPGGAAAIHSVSPISEPSVPSSSVHNLPRAGPGPRPQAPGRSDHDARTGPSLPRYPDPAPLMVQVRSSRCAQTRNRRA